MNGSEGRSNEGRYGVPKAPSRSKRLARSIIRWRREQLRAAGYDEVNAQRLATDPELDLHATMLQADADTELDREREVPHTQEDRPRGG